MTYFRPSRAAAGRLLRLGIILDLRNAPGRVRQIAKMADRAGIDALWVRDYLLARDGAPRLEAWTALTLISADIKRARMCAMLNIAYRNPVIVAAMASALDLATNGRLELGLSTTLLAAERDAFGLAITDEPGRNSLTSYADVVRTLAAGKQVTSDDTYGLHGAQFARAGMQPDGPPITLEISVQSSDSELRIITQLADNVLITGCPAGGVEALVMRVRESAADVGRDPQTLGIALQVPVSVGRTTAEALARAEAEPLFRYLGSPAEAGIFGTLEQCHDRVVEFAHVGVNDLVCVLPNAHDVPDVIAQLTAMAVGSADVFVPGAPRSAAPEAPEGWGGRPRFERA